MVKERYDFDDFKNIMKKLRSEEGCPWDREQNHKSLKRHLIEESYEVIEAIDFEDDDKIKEELGDVLLQVIFHSRIAEEEGRFNIEDVIDGICKKLVSRHAHVFGDVVADTPEEVLASWNKIKSKEKGIKSHSGILKDIPKHFPALLRSLKVQEKAAKAGFDWDDKSGAIEKTREEFEEFIQAVDNMDKEQKEEEMGDILFSIVNVCRFTDIEPEESLQNTVNKFIRRFEYIEKQCNENGKNMEDMTLKELDEIWDQAKEVGL